MGPLSISNFVIEAFIAVTTALGNALVLWVIIKRQQLHTTTNVFIASLAASDMLVGLIGIPCVLVTSFQLPRNLYGCLLVNCTILMFTQVSIFGLLSVALERFVAIRFPFYYTQHLTVRVALVVSAVNWVAGILIGLIPLFGWNLGWNDAGVCNFILVIDLRYHVYMGFFVFMMGPMLIMLAIYVYIFSVLRRANRQIASVHAAVVSTDNLQATMLRKEIKAAAKFGIVIGAFVIAWVPLEITNAVTIWFGHTCIPCIYIGVWLSHLNSAINPFIYAYGNSYMRIALKNTIMFWRTPEVHPESTTSAA
ncbi:Adenosine receptor A2a [Lamellibrachia satsuma]|nr:Adenosine receptor A2a [Lamellibrachia satsuma]